MMEADGGGGGVVGVVKQEARDIASRADVAKIADPIFTSIMFVDATPSIVDIAASFKQHLWPSKRFSGVQKAEDMDESGHFAEEEVPDEDAARAWARRAACKPLARAWRLTVLRAPAPARSAVVVRMHRQVGITSEGGENNDLAELEASLGAPIPAYVKAEGASAKKRDRSSSPQRKEAKVRTSTPGRDPSAAEVARNKIAELEAETRQPVEAKKALLATLKANALLKEVNSNQKGGGGCALYHERRVLLYSTILDLPRKQSEFVKERFTHMGKAFQAKSASTYRSVCDEIENYIRSFT